MDREYLLLTTTFPTKHDADEAAAELIDRRLAACAHVAGPIASTYRWQGKIETSTEWTCSFKLRRDRYDEALAALRKRHPYEVPELVALPIVAGDDAYLRWIDESLDGA